MLTGQAVLTRGRPYEGHGRAVQLMWSNQEATHGRPYGGHVASPGRDTCQVDLAFSAYSWTSYEVTCVTTHRVTRGTLMSSADVAS
jgi:hypothetical protein